MQNTAIKQKSGGKKKKLTPIQKPYLKGSPLGKAALKRAPKVTGMYLIFMFVYLLIGATLTFSNTFLRVAANAVLFAAMCGLMYMDGLRMGDGDVAFAEIAFTRKESGKTVDRDDLARCYHPLKGVLVPLIGAAPFLLCAVVYALIATRPTYQLQSLPSWVSSYNTVEEIALPLSYYSREIAMGLRDILRVIVRLLIYPFVNMVTAENANGLYLLDKLSPLLVLAPTLFYMAGYWQGPHSRAMTHGSIAAGVKRKKRKEARERKARQNKPKELI